MKLTHDGTHFIFECDFNSRHVPKEAGFFWSRDRKRWATSSVLTAVRLRQFADDRANKSINHLFIERKPWPGRLLYPPTQKPMPFQERAARHALEHNRSYLGVDMGLGKTPIASLIINSLELPSVYVCPPYMKPNLEDEFSRWLINREKVWIIKDNELGKVGPEFHGNFGAIIIDEAHRFKNAKAQRSKTLYWFARKFPKVVFMSGTPMPNRPFELYPILRHFAPETIDFMDYISFGTRYCAGFQNQYGWDFTGSSNTEELFERVKDKFMFRLRESDPEVRKDLEEHGRDIPEKHEEIVIVSDSPKKIISMEKSLKKHSPEDLMNQNSDHLVTYRKELGALKVPYVAPLVLDFLENSNEKLLVFGIHKEALQDLTVRLQKYKPILIRGDTPSKDRLKLVNEFQTNGKCRILIGNIQACGTGFNITKVKRIMFLENSWVPGENAQAVARAYRIGQKERVVVQYLVFKNSIDRFVLETVLKKQKTINHL